VRAQWAGRPFIWHIYPQDENLHHIKLKAFLQIHQASSAALAAVSLAWNGATEGHHWPDLWQALVADLPEIARMTSPWQQQMLANGDLAANLLKFARTLGSK
jgi:hypothetical protein